MYIYVLPCQDISQPWDSFYTDEVFFKINRLSNFSQVLVFVFVLFLFVCGLQ